MGKKKSTIHGKAHESHMRQQQIDLKEIGTDNINTHIQSHKNKKQQKNDYSQFRVVPNEKGIKTHNGGLCTPK